MGFLQRVLGVTFRNIMRSCETRKTLNVEPLVRIEITSYQNHEIFRVLVGLLRPRPPQSKNGYE